MINIGILLAHVAVFLFVAAFFVCINYLIRFLKAFKTGENMNMSIWDKAVLISSLAFIITFLIV